MPDGFFRIRLGEARPVYAQETVSVGTLTISGQPAPNVTVYDANGNATAISAALATGYDTAALTAPRVWYILDTTQLAAGHYTLVFTFTALGSDGTSRVYTPNLGVQIVKATD